MAASPNTITLPEKLRPVIEAEIERLIALLDEIDGDPDLEPSLGFNVLMLTYAGALDLEGDTADDEPTMGATEARLGAPMTLFGGSMWSLFPALREPGSAPTYTSAGFCQLAAWAGPTDARKDECEPVCEDEGAQCDDEGVPADNGIADWGGLCEIYAHAWGTFA